MCLHSAKAIILRMRDDFSLVRIRRWGINGGIAITDQGLFSGSNFILNVLLARWLTPEGYGAYALALAMYLFLSGFHNALILEPMSVLATSAHADHLEAYLRSQFVIHAIITASLGVLTTLAAAILIVLRIGNPDFLWALVGVGLFLPSLLLIWLVRRTFY